MVVLMGGCSGCCDEVFEICVDTVGIESIAMNNEGVSPAVALSDTIPAQAFALGAVISTEDSDCTAFDPRALFSQTAYATSCPTEISYRQQIENINIYSLMDFDDAHPAGTDLNDLFERNDLAILSTESNYYSRDTVHFLLFATPSSQMQQFVLEMELDNEAIYRDTTEVLWLD